MSEKSRVELIRDELEPVLDFLKGCICACDNVNDRDHYHDYYCHVVKAYGMVGCLEKGENDD